MNVAEPAHFQVQSDLAARKRWLELLAQSSPAQLCLLMAGIEQPVFTWLRKPQVGLYMVRARIDGSQGAFNLGEIAVTRAVLRVQPEGEVPTVGIGYSLGRNPEHVQRIAMVDALMQFAPMAARLSSQVLEPIEQSRRDRLSHLGALTESTRVEFFSLAREAQHESE